MPKEDYLLKYLEKLSRVLAAMLGLRDKGFPEEALRLADETYKDLLTIDLDSISSMPVNEFIEIVRKNSYPTSYIEALAKITKETANCYTAMGNTTNRRIFSEKALLLYQLLNEKDKTFSFEREMIISELKELIKN